MTTYLALYLAGAALVLAFCAHSFRRDLDAYEVEGEVPPTWVLAVAALAFAFLWPVWVAIGVYALLESL